MADRAAHDKASFIGQDVSAIRRGASQPCVDRSASAGARGCQSGLIAGGSSRRGITRGPHRRRGLPSIGPLRCSWQGFRSYIARYLGADVTIILFANLAEADIGELVEGVATIIDPALAPPPEVSARTQ